ncbi:MAG: QueT transporter family protein [Lachnospiraceae bacterium]|nr:QueT transporter family protein [Lachnospiraceae bacterium]
MEQTPNRTGKHTTLWIAQGAAIAALYVALTLVFAPISYGAVQVRIAEALTILPLFTSAAVPGLFIGCLLANIIGGAIIWDVIFGSIATLIGAVAGRWLRSNRWLVPVPAVLSNTVIVPLVLRYGYGADMSIPVLMLYILIGELIGCCILGEILGSVLKNYSGRIFGTSESGKPGRKDSNA